MAITSFFIRNSTGSCDLYGRRSGREGFADDDWYRAEEIIRSARAAGRSGHASTHRSRWYRNATNRTDCLLRALWCVITSTHRGRIASIRSAPFSRPGRGPRSGLLFHCWFNRAPACGRCRDWEDAGEHIHRMGCKRAIGFSRTGVRGDRDKICSRRLHTAGPGCPRALTFSNGALCVRAGRLRFPTRADFYSLSRQQELLRHGFRNQNTALTAGYTTHALTRSWMKTPRPLPAAAHG
jgi:hypothetical protein